MYFLKRLLASPAGAFTLNSNKKHKIWLWYLVNCEFILTKNEFLLMRKTLIINLKAI